MYEWNYMKDEIILEITDALYILLICFGKRARQHTNCDCSSLSFEKDHFNPQYNVFMLKCVFFDECCPEVV